MENKMLPQQSQDAVKRFWSHHHSMLPPAATPLPGKESSSIALERIFDQINSSSSDIRSVMDLLDSVRSKTNSMVTERKGEDVQRGDAHRGTGVRDRETSLLELPTYKLRDSDSLLRQQSGRNDCSSLSQKNRDFLSIKKLTQTIPLSQNSRDRYSAPIGDIRSSPQSSGDIDVPKLSTVSVDKEPLVESTQLQLPVASVSPQHTIYSRPSLDSLSDGRKLFPHAPAQTLSQVNELPKQACPADQSRSNDMVNQSTQLTIFYGGKVNVYDNVPPEMAKAIMIVASGCNSSSRSFMSNEPSVIRCSPPVDVDDSEPVSLVSKTLSGAANTSTTEMAVEYNSLSEFSATKSIAAPILNPGSTAPMSAAVLPSTSVSTAIRQQMAPGRLHPDLPVARKASLARFLEKRKERSHEKADTNEADKANSLNEEKTLLTPRPKSQKKLCIR
eukprot:c16810_g1_i1 orf=339-1670(-)